MRSALCIGVIALALCAAAGAHAQFPPEPVKLVWEGMFAPPYLTNPQIALAMDCVSENKCYLAGGSNGEGFGVFQYDGKMNGNVVGPMTEPNMSMMVMDLAIGGTEADPKGAFCGITEFGISKAFQYLAKAGTEWLPSIIPPELIYVSEAIAGNADASLLVAVGEGPFSGGSNLMVSTDYGVSFQAEKLNWKAPDNCSAAGYIAMPSANVWFMTFGNEPPQNNGGSGSKSQSSSSFGGGANVHAVEAGLDAKYLNANEDIIRRKHNGQLLVIRNSQTGKVRTHMKSPAEFYADKKAVQAANSNGGDNKCNYYTGYILKSTNKGQSWTKVYENKMAQASFIECFDAESCAVTFFNAGESYTVTTTNGEHFKITYTSPPASKVSAESVQAIAYRSKTEVWAGGSFESQSGGKGMFWSSNDGGNTWTKYPHTVPDVMAIMAMDFKNGVGFALGMTMFKTSQIMRYKNQTDAGYFEQKQCPIAGCTILCQTLSFPQDMCLKTQGGSAKAFCTPQGIEQFVFETTSCVGSYKKYIQPIGKCLNGTNNYFENLCPGNGATVGKARKATTRDLFLH